MARGSIVKGEITKKILEVFEGSFLYNDGKEIRIPMLEEGEIVQVKVSLTAAKTNVEQGEDNALPTAKIVAADSKPEVQTEQMPVELSQEEKDNIQNLLKSIGL